MSSSRLLLLALLVLLALASSCVEGFVLQELPLYRGERNLEEKAFGRALRSRPLSGSFQAFHEPYFIRNLPPSFGGIYNH